MYGNAIGTIPADVYVITPGIDVGTDMGSLDRSFDDSNHGNLKELLIVDSLGSMMVKYLDLIKSSNWDYLMVKCLALHLDM